VAETVFITILGEVLIPLALLARLGLSTCPRRVDWLLNGISFYAYLALISVVGTWLLAPWYLPYGYAVSGLAAAAVSWTRIGRYGPRTGGWAQSVLPIASSLGLTAFCAGMLLWALSGYVPPEGLSVGLASPLKGGTFYVVNGGYSILINPHMKTLARESLSEYRAQSYALDIVRIDRFGRRSQGFWPKDLERYHIFGEPVYAPCAGKVAHVEDQLPDQTPPESDRRQPAGNHVLLVCSEADVLLAHLMRSSVEVTPGQWVEAGQLLGRVGNSGLSVEPHLHLHAQYRGPAGNFLAGEPMPLRIDGRVLVRNSRLTP
jgi:hypothetical protein